MKQKVKPVASLTQPILGDLIERGKAQAKIVNAKISNAEAPVAEQPATYQDAGSGYNRNFVFPQD